jgi:hypothetical protein
MLLMPKSGDNCNQVSEKGWQGGHADMRTNEHVHTPTLELRSYMPIIDVRMVRLSSNQTRWRGQWHPWWGGAPHQGDFFACQAVGALDQGGEGAFVGRAVHRARCGQDQARS